MSQEREVIPMKTRAQLAKDPKQQAFREQLERQLQLIQNRIRISKTNEVCCVSPFIYKTITKEQLAAKQLKKREDTETLQEWLQRLKETRGKAPK